MYLYPMELAYNMWNLQCFWELNLLWQQSGNISAMNWAISVMAVHKAQNWHACRKCSGVTLILLTQSVCINPLPYLIQNLTWSARRQIGGRRTHCGKCDVHVMRLHHHSSSIRAWKWCNNNLSPMQGIEMPYFRCGHHLFGIHSLTKRARNGLPYRLATSTIHAALDLFGWPF